jgi:hypothetical protein
VTNIAALLAAARRSESGLDSSKLRGTATKRAEAEGLVKIEKYHRIVAYLASPSVVEELMAAAVTLERNERELPMVASLLSAALKLGITPEQAVQALVTMEEPGRGQLDLAGLAGLIEAATDDLDAAAVARARLTAPPEEDLSLEDVAATLGFDLGELRAEVEAGTAPAQYATS